MSYNYSDLSSYFKLTDSRGMLVPYRNEEELSFLKNWNPPKKTVITESAAVSPESKNDSLPDMVKHCVKCGNVENKKAGFGTCENGIMIIMNTPASISRIERERLKDNTRDILTKMLSAINVDFKKCYITNLIKCDAENSFKMPGLMLKNCETILIREIKEYNPRIIIVMGDDIPIKKMINETKNINWHKIEHPVSLIKNPELKKPAWATLQKIQKLL